MCVVCHAQSSSGGDLQKNPATERGSAGRWAQDSFWAELVRFAAGQKPVRRLKRKASSLEPGSLQRPTT
eukprot:14273489-Alexandrium_andersonii.AAC.1